MGCNPRRPVFTDSAQARPSTASPGARQHIARAKNKAEYISRNKNLPQKSPSGVQKTAYATLQNWSYALNWMENNLLSMYLKKSISFLLRALQWIQSITPKIFTTKRQSRIYCKFIDLSKTTFQTIWLSMAYGSLKKHAHKNLFQARSFNSVSIFTFENSKEVNLWKERFPFDEHKGQRIDRLDMLIKQAINIVYVSLTMSHNFCSKQEISKLC